MAETGAFISGHYRDGTRLPGTEADGAVLVEPQGATTQHPLYISVGPNGGQAALAWSDETNQTGAVVIQRIGPDLLPLGEASVIPRTQLSEKYAPQIWKGKAVSASGDRTWLAVDDMLRAETFELTEGGIVESKLMSSETLLCVLASDCTGEETHLDVRQHTAVTWKDERWFGFVDESDPNIAVPYRVVRVKPGCVYKSVSDLGAGI